MLAEAGEPASGAGRARLLAVSASPGYGGAERSMEIILSHLPPGAEAVVLAESELHLAALAGRSPPGASVLAVATATREQRARAAFALARAWIGRTPDAVLVNTYDSACLLSAARRVLPEIDRHAFLYVRDFLWPGIGGLLASLPAASVIVPHEVVLERQGYLTPGLLAGRSVHVVPDMAELPASAAPHPTGRGPVLHLATVNPWKGHLHIVAALAELRRRGSAIAVHSHGWAGDAVLRRQVAEAAAAAGLGSSFRLEPHVADPAGLIRSSIAVVVASLTQNGGPETFGRTVIEAWSHCRPVVAFAAGAPGRMIRHGIDGILVPEGDVAALADALQALEADPALQRRLGEAGCLRVRQDYAAPAVVSRLFRILFPAPALPVPA